MPDQNTELISLFWPENDNQTYLVAGYGHLIKASNRSYEYDVIATLIPANPLEKTPDFRDAYDYQKQSRHRVPVPDMLKFPPGTFIKNAEETECPPNFRFPEASVDVDPSGVIYLQNVAKNTFSYHPAKQLHDENFALITDEVNKSKLYAPCWNIISSCFGSSSMLLNAILQTPAQYTHTDYSSHFINLFTAKSQIDHPKKSILIEYADRQRTKSHKDIVEIFFDRRTQEQIIDLRRAIIAQFNKTQTHRPKARVSFKFPWDNAFSLRYTYRTLADYRGYKQRLIQRFTEISYTSPHEGYKVTRLGESSIPTGINEDGEPSGDNRHQKKRGKRESRAPKPNATSFNVETYGCAKPAHDRFSIGVSSENERLPPPDSDPQNDPKEDGETQNYGTAPAESDSGKKSLGRGNYSAENNNSSVKKYPVDFEGIYEELLQLPDISAVQSPSASPIRVNQTQRGNSFTDPHIISGSDRIKYQRQLHQAIISYKGTTVILLNIERVNINDRFSFPGIIAKGVSSQRCEKIIDEIKMHMCRLKKYPTVYFEQNPDLIPFSKNHKIPPPLDEANRGTARSIHRELRALLSPKKKPRKSK
ncbi:hypothetical protein QEH52_00055 [Coraliomargarita sp. SDUM461003]|uniref:Uncharacterized protein n=1 Tax=Thalassobacterium maritimum TaxID=3041265 RepID=A0ABU1AP01_9BACT|nr:hypothetical protein [Coraliomargarita sp. SDUM461003]MDQ8205889.1 hypothetical protein [Coraliomargarita sp. SDUM461003]